MSELLVTQCPYCQTRFRLSQEQLNAAAGNVRCGACLKVFNAVSSGNLQPVSGPALGATPDHLDTSAPPIRQGSLLIHDDLEFDDLDLQALGLDESLVDEVNPPQMIQEFSLDLDPVESESSTDDPEIEPENEAENYPNPPSDEPEAAQTDPYLDLHDDFIATAIQDFGPRPEASSGLDKEQSTDQSAPRFAVPAQGRPLRPLSDERNRPGDDSIFLRDKPDYVTPKLAWHEPGEPIAESSPQPEKIIIQPRPEPEPEPELELDLGELDIPELRDEPIMLDEALQSRRRPRRTWLWGTLCGLAGVALIAQFFVYNHASLSRNQQFRPVMETVCLLAGCELPARVDIDLMRSSNLVVRKHPEFPNALAIDVILYNRADFAQPFPLLRMIFTDPQGREIASRRFRPEEYLSGELAGANLMPQQTPIHVALSMLDPGQRATSYTLEFANP